MRVLPQLQAAVCLKVQSLHIFLRINISMLCSDSWRTLTYVVMITDKFFSCLQITKKQCCWSGALRLGFTSKDPSRINPDSLPKYACPDLVSQSGFWAKALPEEFANEGNLISFWVDKKGRVFYRINDSSPMLFFSGVRTTEPLWALIDVYGLTRGVQLLGEKNNCLHSLWTGIKFLLQQSVKRNTVQQWSVTMLISKFEKLNVHHKLSYSIQ